MTETLFDAIERCTHTAAEAEEIDSALAEVNAANVPDHQVKSMIDYLDSRFLIGAVANDLRDRLELLHQALSGRHFA